MCAGRRAMKPERCAFTDLRHDREIETPLTISVSTTRRVAVSLETYAWLVVGSCGQRRREIGTRRECCGLSVRWLTRACSGRRSAPPLNRWVVGWTAVLDSHGLRNDHHSARRAERRRQPCPH